MALEVASTNEPLRMVTAAIFQDWIDAAAARGARHGLEPDAARTFAVALIVSLEGAFVLARSMRSPEPLITGGQQVRAQLQTSARRRLA